AFRRTHRFHSRARHRQGLCRQDRGACGRRRVPRSRSLMIFAEVIGDPIAQSKSPVIHRYWLDRLGIEGDYVRTRVAADELAGFLARRRSDPEWRGCNVTIPHKETIIPLLDRLDPSAEAIGAVNCVVPEGGALVGYNTDI